jgi:single-strand DNA-binding protein
MVPHRRLGCAGQDRQYLTKGARVYIEGRRGTRSWQDTQTGQDRSRTEVIASDLMMLSQPHDRESESNHVEHEAATEA